MKIIIVICNRIIYLLFPLIHSRKTIFFFFHSHQYLETQSNKQECPTFQATFFSKDFSATGNCTFQRQLRGDRVALRTNVTCVHPKNWTRDTDIGPEIWSFLTNIVERVSTFFPFFFFFKRNIDGQRVWHLWSIKCERNRRKRRREIQGRNTEKKSRIS